jgi:hypothetical protein
MDVKPRSKRIEYETLIADIDYNNRKMILTNKATGEIITITTEQYPEIQAIMADIGHQSPGTQTRR